MSTAAKHRTLFPLGLFHATHNGNTRTKQQKQRRVCSAVDYMCQRGFSDKINWSGLCQLETALLKSKVGQFTTAFVKLN